jgi:hypothetical protein
MFLDVESKALKMFTRFILLMMIFAACRANEMACPRIKTVKLNKHPANYRMRMYSRSLSASNKEEQEKASLLKRQPREVKSSASMEAWDCPKPGVKTTLPKALRKSIRQNRKRFESFYKNKTYPDSLKFSFPASDKDL